MPAEHGGSIVKQRMADLTLKEYAKEESEKVLNGERLLSEKEIMRRWSFDPADPAAVKSFKKLLWKFRTGRHNSGIRLECLPIGGQHRLYRLADLLRVELDLRNWNRRRLDKPG